MHFLCFCYFLFFIDLGFYTIFVGKVPTLSIDLTGKLMSWFYILVPSSDLSSLNVNTTGYHPVLVYISSVT